MGTTARPHGTVEADLGLWDPSGAATGGAVRASATFAVPIHPRGGIPADFPAYVLAYPSPMAPPAF